MSVSTVLLEVVTRDGDAYWRRLAGIDMQATPPEVFDEWQPGRIPIQVRHGGPVVGAVDYIEHGYPDYGRGGLYAVGVVGLPSALVDELVYCSPEVRADALASVERCSYRVDRRVRASGSMYATRAVLDACALVDGTAGVGATRVRAWPGDYRESYDRANMGGLPRVVERAAEAARWDLRYCRPRRTLIHRPPVEVEPRDARGRWPAGFEVTHTAPYPGVLGVRSTR